MTRFLIINADDFGLNHSTNLAIMDLLEKGWITSATLMTPCPWFHEAAEYARTHPEKCIGLHLTFTSGETPDERWRPIAQGEVPSLVDAEGYFYPDVFSVERFSQPADVNREMRAQLAYAERWGVRISHLDNHMGSLYGVMGVQSHLPLVFQLCAERGFPFRLPTRFLPGDAIGDSLSPEVLGMLQQVAEMATALKVPVLDCLLAHPYEKLPGETYETFRDSVCKKLTQLPEGVHELFLHPAVDSPELRATAPHWEKRTWEHRLPADPIFRETLVRERIQVISWREVRAVRGFARTDDATPSASP